MEDGEKDVEACLVATDCQGPDLNGGILDTSGCVILLSSHLQVFGAWTSGMLACRLMVLVAKYLFALPRNGARRSLVAFGN